jgi:hypothetical protein
MESAPPPAPTLETAIRDGLFGEETPLGEIDLRLDRYFETDSGATRASLMNLAIYSERPETLPRDDRSLHRISRNHACRALLLGVSPDPAPLSVRCWTKAQCHLGPDGKGLLCSEQVTFLLGGDCQSCLANLVFSHLRSDLPLVMWWRGELSTHFQESLYNRIDRLIFDSSQWSDPRAGFDLLGQALASGTGRLADRRGQLLIHDLAYTRGHQHRRAVALLFDPPEARESLPALHRIELVHSPGHRLTALYLAAWLTRQLGAEPDASPAGFHRRRDGSSLEVVLREAAGPGPVPSILLDCPDARFEVRSSPESPLLECRARFGAHQLSSFLPGPSDSDEALVSEILMRGGSNLLLARVLPRMRDLLQRQAQGS